MAVPTNEDSRYILEEEEDIYFRFVEFKAYKTSPGWKFRLESLLHIMKFKTSPVDKIIPREC